MQGSDLDFSALNEPPDRFWDMLFRLPFCFDWVEFKGETVFARVNYEATVKAKRPMIDIFYCATQCLNDNVLFTTQWDKNKFSKSKLALEWKG